MDHHQEGQASEVSYFLHASRAHSSDLLLRSFPGRPTLKSLSIVQDAITVETAFSQASGLLPQKTSRDSLCLGNFGAQVHLSGPIAMSATRQALAILELQPEFLM